MEARFKVRDLVVHPKFGLVEIATVKAIKINSNYDYRYTYRVLIEKETGGFIGFIDERSTWGQQLIKIDNVDTYRVLYG